MKETGFIMYHRLVCWIDKSDIFSVVLLFLTCQVSVKPRTTCSWFVKMFVKHKPNALASKNTCNTGQFFIDCLRHKYLS